MDFFASKIKQNSLEILMLLDELLSKEGLLEKPSDFSFEKLQEILQMESEYEKAFNIIKNRKETEARIRMVKEIEEINRLKRENKYFDNSISSELYGKVLDAVDNLTEDFEESEDDNEISEYKKEKKGKSSGMKLQMKKKMVDNLMQIREDSIKMSILFFILLTKLTK